MAVKQNVFKNRHKSWLPSDLLQIMRFILLKTHLEYKCTVTIKELREFFFDPSIRLDSPFISKGPCVQYMAPFSPLKVVIIGGGPAGLTAAIKLAELVDDGRRLKIDIYEKRWRKEVHGDYGFAYYPEAQRRRDQVVTLQNHVLNLLSPECRRTMFPVELEEPENVWPDSCNVQIWKVEDALLRRAQDSEFKEVIWLHGDNIEDDNSLMEHTQGDFHLLVGCDGSGSWVRNRFFHAEKEDGGESLALGIALNTHVKHTLPRPQAMNIFLSLCQTRYMLNASHQDGKGYLNMVLTREEFDSAVTVGGQPCVFSAPGLISGAGDPTDTALQIFAPYRDKSPLWQAIQDGLELFGFKEENIDNIVRIPITLTGVSTPTKTARLHPATTPARRPHFLVSLVGDSALSHHFWAGRGMNSGIKSAVAWANQVSNLILRDSVDLVGLVELREEILAPYARFVENLKRREHEGRSFHILNQTRPGDIGRALTRARKALAANTTAHLSSTQKLVDLVLRFAKSFEGRKPPGWYHEKLNLDKGQVFQILEALTPLNRILMERTSAQPLKKMQGDEVVPESSKWDSSASAAENSSNSSKDPNAKDDAASTAATGKDDSTNALAGASVGAKRRGRPPGSRNKPKIAIPTSAATDAPNLTAERPPKPSRGKSKKIKEQAEAYQQW